MRIAPAESSSGRRAGRTEPVILFLVSGQMFAVSAGAIHEIRSTDSLSGSAMDASEPEVPKVRHRLLRDRKPYYVVNSCVHFGLPATRPTLVLIMRNAPVALLVDRIDRMDAMSLLMVLPHAFCGAERAWYRGITVLDDAVVPIVNPLGFLTEKELSLLDAAAAAGKVAMEGHSKSAEHLSADVQRVVTR